MPLAIESCQRTLLYIYILAFYSIPVIFTTYAAASNAYFNESVIFCGLLVAGPAYILWHGLTIKKVKTNRLDWMLTGICVFVIVLPLTIRYGLDESQQYAWVTLLLLVNYWTMKTVTSNPDGKTIHQYVLLTLALYLISVSTVELFRNRSVDLGKWVPLSGSFVNPNIFAGYLVLLGPLLWAGKNCAGKILHIATVSTSVVLTLLLFLTQSRAGIISLMVLWASFMILTNKGSIRLRVRWLVIGVILSLPWLWYLFMLKSNSYNGRKFILELACLIANDVPTLGYGFASFEVKYNATQASFFQQGHGTAKQKELADVIHFAFNEYLHLFIEFGVIFILVFAILTIVVASAKTSSDSVLSKCSLLSICVFAAFSYAFHVLSIGLIISATLAMQSNGFKPDRIFSFGTPVRRSLLVLTALLIFVPIWVGQLTRIKYALLWKQADEMAEYHPAAASEIYKKALPFFKTEGLFLFKYGKALHEAKNYRKSSEILEMSLRRSFSIEANMMQAYNLAKINHQSGAINCFEKAIYVSPNRLLPKYNFMSYLIETGDKPRALNLAYEITRQAAKIETPDAIMIKQAAAYAIQQLK